MVYEVDPMLLKHKEIMHTTDQIIIKMNIVHFVVYNINYITTK